MKTFRKIMPYIINIAIVITIFIGVLIISKTSPFGNNVLGKSDSIAQYKPMLFNFITNLKKGSLDLFSFNNGLGNPFLFNYLYYLISPLNLIAIFFNKADNMFLSVITLKIIITTINVTFYVRQKNKSNIVSIIACLSYIFSTWLTTYYFQIMWLDTFMIFPLFQLGLEKILNNKPLTLILTTSYLIISNFYLAFSVLIYGLIYLIIVNFFYQEKTIKEKFKTFFLYFISNIASALIISGFIWILLDIKNKMNLSFSSIEYTDYNVTIINFIKSLFYGNSVISLNETNTFPNTAMNTLLLLNVFYTFLNKDLKKKDKVFILIGIVLAISCFFIKKLDFAMNFFHNINGYTYRYTFIFNFLLIALFIRNTKNINNDSFKKIFIITIPLIVILLTISKAMETRVFITNFVFLLAFTILSLIYKNKKIYQILLVSLIIIESSIISYFIIPSNMSNTLYPINEDFQKEKNPYRLNYLDEENTYFNQNLYKNIDTTLLFSTMTYKNVISTFKDLGCKTDVSTIYCDNENELVSLLFNVKLDDQYLEKIYAANHDVQKTILIEDNIKFSEEELIKNMTSIENIFDKEILTGELKDDAYYFKTDHPYYFIEYHNEDDTYETYAQAYKEFYIKDTTNNKVTIYTLNEKKLKDIYSYLARNQIKYTHYQDSFIEGTINVDENQMIFTSIPYDSSWIIKVDNQIVKPTKVLNSLLGIEVKPGEHKISMQYKTNYKGALLISFISILITLVITLYPKKKKI